MVTAVSVQVSELTSQVEDSNCAVKQLEAKLLHADKQIRQLKDEYTQLSSQVSACYIQLHAYSCVGDVRSHSSAFCRSL